MGSTSAGAKSVVIIGGGPAGLTAAYELCKHRMHGMNLEECSFARGDLGERPAVQIMRGES